MNKENKDDLINRSVLKGLISNKSIPIKFEEEKRGNWQNASGLLLSDIYKIINNAPTVEPCKDCEDRRQAEYIRHGSSWHELQALRKFKEEHERPQGEWISVSERLPENRDWYLGIFKEPDTDFIGIPYICDYVGEVTKGTTNEGWILRNCTDVDNASDYFRNLICVAWQPLPELYKEGGTE